MRKYAGSCTPPLRAPARLCVENLIEAPSRSFDHLVRSGEQFLWDADSKRLGSLEVDDKVHFRGLLDRQVRRVLAAEDSAGVSASQAVRLDDAAAVTGKAARRSKLGILKD